jgi:hypothetical protein
MKVYTFSEARQNFAAVLDLVELEGAVRITRRDGRAFVVRAAQQSESPLAVPGHRLNLDRDEIVAAVRESRER